MKRDRILHLSLNLLLCAGRRHAPRKVGRVRGISAGGLFDHDQVLHCFNPACFKTLFSVPWRQVVARLPGDRDESWFRRVLELSMRTTLANRRPTIVLQHLDYVANLHNRASGMVILPAIMPPFLNDRNRARRDAEARYVRARDHAVKRLHFARTQKSPGTAA